MVQVSLEDYIKRLRKQDPAYQWPLEKHKERETKRQKFHREFPYVITYSGYYGHGGLLDNMEDWCRKEFGDSDGECHWSKCPESWDTWYEKAGWEDVLMKELDEEHKRNPKPDEKDKKAMKKWRKIDDARDIIGKHFEMIKTVGGQPPDDHFHTGTWTYHFVMKTGYDYGYEDYCFKNHEDAVYFKLMWAEEAERRS